MSDEPRPSDIEAPAIEPQDRFIAPDQPEDEAARLDSTEPDPALEEEAPENPGSAGDTGEESGPETDDEKLDRESEESFPASDPPSY